MGSKVRDRMGGHRALGSGGDCWGAPGPIGPGWGVQGDVWGQTWGGTGPGPPPSAAAPHRGGGQEAPSGAHEGPNTEDQVQAGAAPTPPGTRHTSPPAPPRGHRGHWHRVAPAAPAAFIASSRAEPWGSPTCRGTQTHTPHPGPPPQTPGGGGKAQGQWGGQPPHPVPPPPLCREA